MIDASRLTKEERYEIFAALAARHAIIEQAIQHANELHLDYNQKWRLSVIDGLLNELVN